MNIVFTQISTTQGIKKYGEKAIAAIFKELKQLNDGAMPDKPVVEAISFIDLSHKDKDKAVKIVNLIKEKDTEN